MGKVADRILKALTDLNDGLRAGEIRGTVTRLVHRDGRYVREKIQGDLLGFKIVEPIK